MSEIYITSDLHLGHDKNKVGYGGIIHHAKRPFSCIEEHDQFIIDQWNNMIGSKDLTYICGDFAWRNHNHYIHALRGKKILITGSHDKMPQDAIRLFTGYHVGMFVTAIKGVRFCLTHCAMLVWEGSHYNSINCHGHSHGRIAENDTTRRMDVGVDVSNNYIPFNIDFVLYKMSLKKERDHNRTSNPEELDELVARNKEANTALLSQFSSIPSTQIA